MIYQLKKLWTIDCRPWTKKNWLVIELLNV